MSANTVAGKNSSSIGGFIFHQENRSYFLEPLDQQMGKAFIKDTIYTVIRWVRGFW